MGVFFGGAGGSSGIIYEECFQCSQKISPVACVQAREPIPLKTWIFTKEGIIVQYTSRELSKDVDFFYIFLLLLFYFIY